METMKEAPSQLSLSYVGNVCLWLVKERVLLLAKTRPNYVNSIAKIVTVLGE